jgi:hypothetical protein
MPSATIPSTVNAQTRIPAWKRLGLKLKSQSTPEPESDSLKQIETSKRKSPDTTDERPTKRSKKSKQLPVQSEEEPITPQLVRKKSVTFTPETKAEDGDSIKQLFNSWVAEQKEKDPSFQLKDSNPVFRTPVPSEVEAQVDPSLDEKERRVKRVKKSKEDKANGPKAKNQSKIIKTAPASSKPFLQYLRQYSESRTTWKFNKNHQTHLLKHIFNLEVIPSDHAHFIYEYVRGLQGGVRTRLRDTALEVKVKDEEDGVAGFPANMGELEKRQREYDAAMKEYVATITLAEASPKMGYEEGVLLGLSDSAMENRVAKRMRAEEVLAELSRSRDGGGVSKPDLKGDEDSEKRVRMNNGSSQKVVRKRKQRTINLDSDASFSDDSSDSDESSDDSTAQNDEGDETSSSSSSSSSGSDSEDESKEDSEEESEERDDSD